MFAGVDDVLCANGVDGVVGGPWPPDSGNSGRVKHGFDSITSIGDCLNVAKICLDDGGTNANQFGVGASTENSNFVSSSFQLFDDVPS